MKTKTRKIKKLEKERKPLLRRLMKKRLSMGKRSMTSKSPCNMNIMKSMKKRRESRFTSKKKIKEKKEHTEQSNTEVAIEGVTEEVSPTMEEEVATTDQDRKVATKKVANSKS